MIKNIGIQNLILIKKLSLLAFLVGFTTNFSFSQIESYQFQHINSNNGLKNPYNSFIKKDSKGFVWISSMEGVYCYDGLELKTYLPTKTNGLLGKNIQSDFFEDKDKNIWFSSYQALNCYIRKKDSFKSIQLVDELGNNINKGYHLFFIEKSRFLWLKANSSIFRYDLLREVQDTIIDTKGYRFTVDTFPSGQIKTIIACPWISNPGIEIISASKIKNTFNKKTFLKSGFPPEYEDRIEISKAIIVNDSLIWLFSNKGLLKFNPQNPSEVDLFTLPIQLEDKVLDGEMIDNNNILIISRKSGLWYFNEDDGFTLNYVSDDNDPTSISTNNLREIYLDNENHLWLANNFTAAIDYSWRFENRFINLFKKVNINPTPVVNSIVEDFSGNIYCSTQNQGIFKFGKSDTLIKIFPYINLENKSEGLQPINRLSIDEEGYIWALSNEVIYRFDDTSWQIVFNLKNKKLLSLLHLNKKTKLVSTSEGVFELEKNVEGNQLKIKAPIEHEDKLLVFQFFKSKNYVFFPNNTSDLLIYNYINNQFDPIKKLEVNADIYAIFEDTDNEVCYLGTSNGLLELKLKDLTLKNILEEDPELQNVQFFSVQQDKNGFLWLATNVGLWRYNPITHEKNSFNFDNDPSSNHFSLYANLKSAEGDIWLGLDNGILSFSPDSISPYPYEAKIHIKSLEVNQVPFKNKGTLDNFTPIELDYDKNTLEFQVVGISSYFPETVKIDYLLEGYDKKWQLIPNGQPFKFIRVPSGEYSLKLRSINANGVVGKIKEIKIRIKPPFWQTSWFICSTILLLLLLGYITFKYIVNQKLKKQEAIFKRKEEMNNLLQEERNRIAADMHDDLGSGLNSITLLIKSVKRQTSESKISSKLDKIEDKATNLVTNMREIIWTMDGSNDNLEELIAYTRHYVVEYLDEYNISCTANFPENLPQLALGGKKRRNIFLCIKEAAHNIVKHAEASKVKLNFAFSDGLICISIKDNGRGIKKSNNNNFGNGLKNMKYRMEQIKGKLEIKVDNGTILIFQIPLINKL